MQVEIINTGSELLLGRVLNTHQQFLCRALADLGYTVVRQTAVPDTAVEIRDAVRDALGRSDLLITTGGLGPTSDDRTRDLIAGLLDLPLETNAEVLQRIKDFFCGRPRGMPPSTAVQALVPAGAFVLINANGTAPGIIIDIPPGKFRAHRSWLIMLPGPPRELRPMFLEQVIPFLREHLPANGGFACRALKTTGVGESRVEELIAPKLKPLTEAGLDIGYCARPGEVDVRFVARGADASSLVNEAEQLTRRLLGPSVFGVDDDQLEEVVVRLLTEKKRWLALAESCTGGYISHRLTNVPGASAVLWGGAVSYANEAKIKLLGVRTGTLETHGAVSDETAREMAQGIRSVAGSDFGLAVTGIAGPSGGGTERPVGTVFIALARADGTDVERYCNRFDRETFKYVTSQQALEMVRRRLIEMP